MGVDWSDGLENVSKYSVGNICNHILTSLGHVNGDGPVASAFRIGHLSDLHFCFSSSAKSDRHDTAVLEKLEKLSWETVQCIAVSGDLTSDAEENSFERSYEWLTSKTRFGGKDSGIDANAKKLPLVVVPGNSDAHDDIRDSRLDLHPPFSTATDLWPAIPPGCGGWSLSRFKSTYCGSTDRASASVRWFRHESDDYVVVYRMLSASADSGDHRTRRQRPSLTVAAAEKVFKSQLSCLRQHHQSLLENGSHGDGVSPAITREQYLRSAKILIMHHPLDPNNGCVPDRCDSRTKHRIQAVASLGIHAVLCGHGHRSSFGQVRPSTTRGTTRDIEQIVAAGLNYPPHFSRSLKRKGTFLPKPIVKLLISWGVSKPTDSNEGGDWHEHVEDNGVRSIAGLLYEASVDGNLDTIAARLVRRFLLNMATDTEKPTEQSWQQLQYDVDSLTKEQAIILKRLAKHREIKRLETQIKTWKIAQFRCGSSAKVKGKRSVEQGLTRSLGFLGVSFSESKVILQYQEHRWDDVNRQFTGPHTLPPCYLDRW
jgi:hypothetical protein